MASRTATPGRISFHATVALDLEARGAPEGAGAVKRPTFAIKAYTGAVMSAAGFYSPVIVELSGLKAGRDRIPILLDHDPSRIIGQTDDITIDASGVTLTGSITGEDASAESVLTHARNGFEWQASIGAKVIRQEYLKAGEKAVVNGREVGGPLLVARESRLYETSFVAIGADAQTTASVAASQSFGSFPRGETTMLDTWLTAKGFDPAALSDPQRSFLQACYDEETTKPPPSPPPPQPKPPSPKQLDSFEAIVRGHEAEIDRQNRIMAHLDTVMAERPELIPDLKKLGEVAIASRDTRFEEVEVQVMRLERRRGPGATLVRGGRKIASRMIEATVARACGLRDIEKSYDGDTLNASYDQFPNGMGLRDLLLLAARENGYGGFSTSNHRELLEAAFPPRGPRDIRAEGISTLSLPGLMSNVANKFLLQGFTAVESTWRDVAATGNARDFKTFYSYNFLMDTMFAKVGNAGELEHATASELEYTNKVDTYGKMFAVTRQDLVNDDLGALSQIPMRLGRGAAIGLNMLFWTEFLANAGTFYTGARGNVSTGAGSTLTSDGLKAAQLKFKKQTDPNGDPLGIEPRILLVPPELEIAADELMTSLIVNTGGSSTTDKVPNRNVWANKYRVVVSSYLSNTNITGNSATAWYLIADPMDLPLIQVAFLNGKQEPTVESADADFNTLGIQFRGFWDVGSRKQEFRAAVRSAGS